MRVKYALTLQNQLALPLIPFCIDLFARVVFLGGRLPWYQLPDLWTFLVTYAFFCLGLMVSITPVELPTDLDASVNAELVRQRLLAYAIVSVAFAGGISFFRAFDELFPEHRIYEEHGLALFIAVFLFASHTMFQICRTHLSYVGRD
jgi:hypothetical protein